MELLVSLNAGGVITTRPAREDKQEGLFEREVALPRIGRDEMNLCEFPFALLSDRAPKDLNTIVFSDRVAGKDKVPVERVWTVTGSDKFGLPTAGDEQIYVALMEVTREQGFQNRRVYITRYDLIKRLGWADKGQSYQRLRDGLDRLLGVTIKADRAFWDNAARRYVSVGFHIIDDYALYDEMPGRKSAAVQRARMLAQQVAADGGAETTGARNPGLPLSYISWNTVIFSSFQAGNVKQLDADFYFSLRSAISRRLFRYLDKKRYDGKASFRIGLQKLAFEKLGMSRNYFPSHIRQELRRAHEELCENGYLRDVEFCKPDRRAPEQVIYHFSSRRAAGPVARPQASPAENAIIKQLAEVGVTERVARELTRDFGGEIAAQLAYLPSRRADDPAAVLVEAIRNHWGPPASYQRTQAQEQQIAREVSQMQAAEAVRQAEETARAQERERQQGQWDALLAERREAIEAAAAAALAATNPIVAQRPESAAYRALMRAECMKRMVHDA